MNRAGSLRFELGRGGGERTFSVDLDRLSSTVLASGGGSMGAVNSCWVALSEDWGRELDTPVSGVGGCSAGGAGGWKKFLGGSWLGRKVGAATGGGGASGFLYSPTPLLSLLELYGFLEVWFWGIAGTAATWPGLKKVGGGGSVSGSLDGGLG